MCAALCAILGPALGQPEQQRQDACKICFYGPDNIAFDRAGAAYVVDNDHRSRFRILKISAGEKIGDWRVFAPASVGGGGPEGIAIDRRDRVLVTDAARRQILILSPEGKLLSTLGTEAVKLHNPGHVAIGPDGSIFVSEAPENRIVKFAPHGQAAVLWKRQNGSGPKDWDMPESIATLQDGNLVVEDWGNRRILVLNPNGQTLRTIGGKGTEPGQFENSAGFFVDRFDRIYVADWKLHRVQTFDETGKLLRVVGTSADHILFANGPTSIGVDRGGNLYAADGLSIVKFSDRGVLLGRWR